MDIFHQFKVLRLDGREDRNESAYFVLDLKYDPIAREAAWAYAAACQKGYPALAYALRAKIIGYDPKYAVRSVLRKGPLVFGIALAVLLVVWGAKLLLTADLWH